MFTLGTAVLMAMLSALFLMALRGGLTGNLDTTLLTRAGDVVAQLRADRSATVSTETSQGIFVQILSPTGAVIDGADVLGAQTLLSAPQAHAASTAVQTVDRHLTFPAPPVSTGGSTDDVRVVAVPGPPGMVVAAGTSRDSVDDALRRSGVQLLLLAAGLVAVSAVGSWLLARAALRPVEAMRHQVSTLRTHDAADGIDVPAGRDELTRLAVTFNDLLGRLHHAVQREQAFVADAGHELRTPLTVLQGELELAQRPGRSITELRTTVAVAAYETQRLVRLSEDLLVLARTGDLDPPHVAIDLVDLVRAALTAAQPAAHTRDIGFRQRGAASLMVTVHPADVRRAVDNVVANAMRYAPDHSHIDVTVSSDPADAAWKITVTDHGPGFPPAFLPHAFERFTQADTNRPRLPDDEHPHGAGLGLAIVRSIMTSHGGTATAYNHPAGGAVVELCGPR